MIMNRYAGKKVAVLGMGKSGIAVAKKLEQLGAYVFVSDSNPMEKLVEFVSDISSNKIQYEVGGHTDKVIDSDIIVMSPGVPLSLPIVKKAKKMGIPVIGEIEFAYGLYPDNWISVTGTNGKSTTSVLIGEILKGEYGKRVCVAGNIGTPVTDALNTLDKESILVAELSSFQLETIDKFNPDIAVVLNLSPDHLDRYNNEEDYYNAKKRIYKNMGSNGYLVLNADDKRLKEWGEEAKKKVKVVFFSLKKMQNGVWVEEGIIKYKFDGVESDLMSVKEINLKGMHNLSNQLAAVAVAKLKGLTDDKIKRALKNFSGLEHRMEFVKNVDGVDFYNDSKATTVESVACALDSFESPVVLIAGGYSKDGDYSKLSASIKEHCSNVILLGDTANEMNELWNKIVPVSFAKNMEEAVSSAKSKSRKGDVVLLSPACASFDMYKNYKERGSEFKKAVGLL